MKITNILLATTLLFTTNAFATTTLTKDFNTGQHCTVKSDEFLHVSNVEASSKIYVKCAGEDSFEETNLDYMAYKDELYIGFKLHGKKVLHTVAASYE